jgi:hypothetical protein
MNKNQINPACYTFKKAAGHRDLYPKALRGDYGNCASLAFCGLCRPFGARSPAAKRADALVAMLRIGKTVWDAAAPRLLFENITHACPL